jgi:hypothetical protein
MEDILAAAIWEKRKSRETMVRFAERGRERVCFSRSEVKPVERWLS